MRMVRVRPDTKGGSAFPLSDEFPEQSPFWPGHPFAVLQSIVEKEELVRAGVNVGSHLAAVEVQLACNESTGPLPDELADLSLNDVHVAVGWARDTALINVAPGRMRLDASFKMRGTGRLKEVLGPAAVPAEAVFPCATVMLPFALDKWPDPWDGGTHLVVQLGFRFSNSSDALADPATAAALAAAVAPSVKPVRNGGFRTAYGVPQSGVTYPPYPHEGPATGGAGGVDSAELPVYLAPVALDMRLGVVDHVTCPEDCTPHGRCDPYSRTCVCNVGWQNTKCSEVIDPTTLPPAVATTRNLSRLADTAGMPFEVATPGGLSRLQTMMTAGDLRAAGMSSSFSVVGVSLLFARQPALRDHFWEFRVSLALSDSENLIADEGGSFRITMGDEDGDNVMVAPTYLTGADVQRKRSGGPRTEFFFDIGRSLAWDNRSSIVVELAARLNDAFSASEASGYLARLDPAAPPPLPRTALLRPQPGCRYGPYPFVGFDAEDCADPGDDGGRIPVETADWTVDMRLLVVDTELSGPCSRNCSGLGTCKGGSCECFEPQLHAGPACDLCAPGRFGWPACNSTCPGGASLPCSGRGRCDTSAGECRCDAGWFGESCAQFRCDGANGTGDDVCGAAEGRGQCVTTAQGYQHCRCAPAYAGLTCDVCAGGRFGDSCAALCPGVDPNDPGPRACAGHGSCAPTGPGEALACACDPGYAGVACTERTCGIGQACSPWGRCDAETGVCSCNATRAGAACEQCAPGRTGAACGHACGGSNATTGVVCGGHGLCLPEADGVCLCSPATGWNGDACLNTNCKASAADASDCSGRGDCLVASIGLCGCHRGFGGAFCADCADGFFGADCAGECPGGAANQCSGHGECSKGADGTGKCTCNVGWTGADCSRRATAGVAADVPLWLLVLLAALFAASLAFVAVMYRRWKREHHVGTFIAMAPRERTDTGRMAALQERMLASLDDGVDAAAEDNPDDTLGYFRAPMLMGDDESRAAPPAAAPHDDFLDDDVDFDR